jgi:hypothetical protein
MSEIVRNAMNNFRDSVGIDKSKDKRLEKHNKAIIKEIKQSFKERADLRKLIELQWLININFYEGNQYVAKETMTGKLFETAPLYYFEERQVYNQIAPIVETRLAKLSRLKNQLKTRTPPNADVESEKKAKLSNKILAGTQVMLRMSEKQEVANSWTEITGAAVYKTVWNSTMGKTIGVINEDKIYEEENLEEYERELAESGDLPLTRVLKEGWPDTEVISPFEIFPEDPYKSKNRSIMHVKVFSVDELYENFGIIDKGSSNDVFSMTHSSYPVGNAGSKTFEGKAYKSSKENSVLVYELFGLPTRRYPEGRWVICTDKKMINNSPLPDYLKNDGEYVLPFDVQKSINKLDYFFGDTVVSRLIPVQRAYNTIKNRKREYINRITIGVLTAETNSIQDIEDLEEEGIAPGRVIQHTVGTDAPKYLTMPTWPAGLDNEEDKLLKDFSRLSGVSEFSKQSVVPSGVDSGVAIGALAEQDDTRMGLTANNIKKTLMSVGMKWLIYYKNMVSYDRYIKYFGEDDSVDIVAFRGDDISSFEVFIEAVNEISETYAQRKAFIIQMLNGGFFNDPEKGNISREGRAKILEMLEMGDWENFDNEDALQLSKAKRENAAMAKLEPVQPKSIDDDVVHITEHIKWMLAVEYEEMVKVNPMINEMANLHVSAHMSNMAKKTTASMSAQPQVQSGQTAPAAR